MFCENCGTTLRDGALFCTNCGAKVQPLVQTEIPKAPQPPVIPQPPQAAQPPRADKAPAAASAASASSFAQAARPAQSADPFRAAESAQSGTIRADAPKKNLLPWILGVAGVAVLVLLVVLLWPKHSSAAATEPLTLDIPDSPNSAGTGADHGASAGQSSDGSDGERADEGNYLYIKDTLTYRTYDDESTDFMDKNGRAHHLSDGWPGWSIHAADDSRMVVSYDDGVYLYDGSDSGQWIAPEESGFLISYDGSAVALTVPEGDSRALRLIRGDEQIQIDAGEAYYQMTLSPHGEALCYGYEVDGEWSWYLWKDGEQTYLDIDTSYVMALDDEASLIYYLGWKNHGFYVRTPEGDRMLGASDDNGLQSKNFNCDNTEVLFEDDGSTYLSVRGGEPQLLTTTSCWPLVPNGTQIFQLSADAFVHQRGIRTFAGAFCSQYRTDTQSTDILYLDENRDLTCVAEDTAMYALARDGKTLVWLSRGRLCRADGTEGPYTLDECMLRDGVAKFQLTDDGSRIFFLDAYLDLYVLRGSGEPEQLSPTPGETNWYSPANGIAGGTQLFYAADGHAWRTDGGEPVEITGVAGAVTEVYANGWVVTIYSNIGDTRVIYTYFPAADLLIESSRY